MNRWRPQHRRWLGIAALLTVILHASLRAAQWEPQLGLALEMIDGGRPERVEDVRPDPATATRYPLPAERPRPILTEVPGKPFRQVHPMPEVFVWWKAPLYGLVGLPRDLIDAAFGVAHGIPIVGVAAYAAYELIPTQWLFRDPRDRHRWPGLSNARGHGAIDGPSWGWFPSLHTWTFLEPSPARQAANRAYNDALLDELNALNREIESYNRALSDRQREAREQALAALEAGDFDEAAARMVPFLNVPWAMDEGTEALLIAAMAFAEPSPGAWQRRLLWALLDRAGPRTLDEAERLIGDLVRRHPARPAVSEALIYCRLKRDRTREALAEAERLAGLASAEAVRARRLLFETALAARDADAARRALAAISPAQLPGGGRRLLEARLMLLDGETTAARTLLAAFAQENPQDPYLLYYLGCADVIDARRAPDPLPGLRAAFGRFERAALGTDAPRLQRRAGEALAYVRAELAARQALHP